MQNVSRRSLLKIAAAGAAGVAGLVRIPLQRTVRASNLYSSVVLAKGPVGYWRLGELGGPTAADVSGNGYDGTYLGNPDFGQPGAIVGDSDTAVGLHGYQSRDYVEIADPLDASAAFSQPTSGLGLTVEVWMRPDVVMFPGQTADPYIHWLGKGEPSQYEWGFRFYSLETSRPNRISAYIWNPGNPAAGEGAGAYFQDDVVPGEWMHIVACYEPGDKDTIPPAGVHIYKNGVHRQGPPSSGTLYSNPLYNIVPAHGAAPVRLGARSSNLISLDYTLNGALDEVAIYPRVLGPDEILENYQTGVGA
jgi:hypothetical protein